MMPDFQGDGRFQKSRIDLNLHELPPMALRAFNADLGSLLQSLVLRSAGLQPSIFPAGLKAGAATCNLFPIP
jgi:hypothetical protein